MKKLKVRVKLEDIEFRPSDDVSNGKYSLNITAVGQTRILGLTRQGEERTMMMASIVRWNGKVVL